jgi:hypothetical protein
MFFDREETRQGNQEGVEREKKEGREEELVVKALLTPCIVLEKSSHQDNSNNTKEDCH